MVKKLPWRSVELTHVLRALDLWHLSRRFSKKGKPTKGALPHVRTVKDKQIDHDAMPVSGLPRNFYCSSWLALQDNAYITELDIRPPIPLEIPNAIQKCVFLPLGSLNIVNKLTNANVGKSIASSSWENMTRLRTRTNASFGLLSCSPGFSL